MRNLLTTVVVSTLFFLSGGCALVYESLWTRYLAELTGGTALSQLIVLMVFMGGLALGAMLIGRLVDRRLGQGLFIYGLLEAGIGLYAMLFPQFFQFATELHDALGVGLSSGSAGLLGLKVLLAFLLIIVPAVAMGGTLPAITRYLTQGFSGLRTSIGLLYGMNSLGAVLGILAGGFFLLHFFGIQASMQVTGLFNLGIGLTALIYARFVHIMGRQFAAESSPLSPSSGEKLDSHRYSPEEVRRAIIVAALSGFGSMALQVAWIRYVAITLGATHSSFTIVVAAFVFGIGLGSLLVRTRVFGRIPLPQALAGLLLLTTAFLWLQLFFYDRVPFEIQRFLGIFAHTPYAWPFFSVAKFGMLFGMMVLPTLASGMILPLCIRLAERGTDLIGRDVARVYAVNTVAAILGVLVTGQFLFRVLSLPRTLQVVMLIYLATTVFAVFALPGKSRRAALAVMVVMAVGHFAFWRPWSPERLFVSRVHFGQHEPQYYGEFLQGLENKTVVEDRQGPDVSVTVLDAAQGDVINRSMVINGKPDAGTNTDMPVQILVGHIPVLLHPDPGSVFVLGLGSGITSGEILKFETVDEVVTAELAAEVFEASKTFADYNDRFWENPRHRMVIEDGKTFLRLSQKKFDVITLEPTNIWQAGMAGLFTEEFFRIVRSKLAPGGVVGQWLHTYMINDLSVNLVLKTFSRVFPGASVFQLDDDNLLLVGYGDGWRFDPESLTNRFNQPRILESQNKIGNVNPAAMLLREVMDRHNFQRYTSVLSMPVNTMDFPVLEQSAEYSLFMQRSSTLMQRLDIRLESGAGNSLLHDFTREVGFDLEEKKAIAASGLLDDNPRLKESMNFMLLDALWNETTPAPPMDVYGRISDAQLREIIKHPSYRRAPEQMSADEAYNLLGAELYVWTKTASRIWTPDPVRMFRLFDRISTEIDPKTAGTIARNAAISLGFSRSCKVAMPFFRAAKAKGELEPETLSPGELEILFTCEVKVGDSDEALRWWQAIEERGLQVSAAMQREKDILEIKRGNPPPEPFHGRLPSLW